MSLIFFHRFLIVTAIAFCAGFAAWEVVAFRRVGGGGALLLAAIFLVLAIGLAVYLWRLDSILGYDRAAGERDE